MPGKNYTIKTIDFNEYRDLVVFHESTETNVNVKKSGNVEKSAKLPKPLTASCDFDYLAEKLTLSFKSSHAVFQPMALKVYFRKNQIVAVNFDKGFQVSAPNDVLSIPVSFHKIPIDFFGFSLDRIFKIVLEYNSVVSSKLEASFTITLPVIKTNELFFNAPGTQQPSPTIRRICQQGFKMTDINTNSYEEIQTCVILEEFKLIVPEERYKVYGYVAMLKLFLDIENSFELDLLKKSDLVGVKIFQQNLTHYRIDTPGQIPKQASSVRMTPLPALCLPLTPKELHKFQISAPIKGFHRNFVTIEINRKGKNPINSDELYHVEFLPNFFSNAMAQRALNRIKLHNYEPFMLEFTRESLPSEAINGFKQFHNFEWLNQSVGSNFGQSTAIQHIVNRTSFPSPYIVFGPPGTGKTSTLVEAVAQIVKLQPNARILISVNSNSACDEIGERLMSYVGRNKMFRYYAPSFAKKMERVNKKLIVCSNLKYGYHIQPSLQEMMSYNVTIGTLVNCGRLRELGSKDSTHFDYIFIDECASSAEAYVSIPIALAMKRGATFKPSLVLLGDPKQLGQIMRTFHSERFGFNISMMERAMGMDMYKYRNKKFGTTGYDPRYIVQLTDNFRSHASILSYSNKQFYNSILVAKQTEKIANFAIGWEKLPNKDFPVMFHSSWTKSESEGTSLFNMGDIYMVRNYVRSLLSTGINGQKVSTRDIGVICPYAAQREKLREVYPTGIEIGTVEYYQGREKKIIILSTVRSGTPTVGFLKNEKRLNVAMTRAKALLIVIGNPETLGKNHFWREFIKMCCLNKAVVGKVPAWLWREGEKTPNFADDDDDEVIRLEELMNGLDMDD